MEEGIVSHYLEAGLGNTCLMVYKAFKFCSMRGVGFDRLRFNADSKLHHTEAKVADCPLFDNVRRYFVDGPRYKELRFGRTYRDWTALGGVEYDGRSNVRFAGFNWVYPETVQDFLLFNSIFDNREYARSVFCKYRKLFDGPRPVIGMTVRRGDFVGLRMFYT